MQGQQNQGQFKLGQFAPQQANPGNQQPLKFGQPGVAQGPNQALQQFKGPQQLLANNQQNQFPQQQGIPQVGQKQAPFDNHFPVSPNPQFQNLLSQQPKPALNIPAKIQPNQCPQAQQASPLVVQQAAQFQAQFPQALPFQQLPKFQQPLPNFQPLFPKDKNEIPAVPEIPKVQPPPALKYEKRLTDTLEEKKQLVECLNQYIKGGNPAFATECLKQIIDSDFRVRVAVK